MKRNRISLIILVLMLMANTVIFAGHQPVDIRINGKDIYLENQLYTNEKGIEMLPIRNVAEELGYKVIWDSIDREVSLIDTSSYIKLKINNPKVETHNRKFELNNPPIIKDEKTYVPLEFISKALDIVVNPNYDVPSFRTKKENSEDFFNSSQDFRLKEKLDNYMEKLQENKNFHGSVLIAKDGEILLNKGYGAANFEQALENKSQTKFSIGSVTKQITALAIMQLEERGLLSVDDKLSKYFPDFPNGDKISIHNLLTHTSGLENYTNETEFFLTDISNKDPKNMLTLIEDKALLFTPGEEYSYSNTNYLLLGMIVEHISEMDYGEYLKENIFKPLNMLDTDVAYGKNMDIPDVNTYAGYLEFIPVDDDLILSQAYGAGNIHSTVEDLYRWDRALKDESLVEKETLDKIFKEYIDIGDEMSYGYGWIIRNSPFGKQIFHGGNTFGSTAYIQNFSDRDISIIILTNTAAYDTETLSNTILNILFDRQYEMPERQEEIDIKDKSIYDEYIGEYDMGSGLLVSITREEDNLFAQLTGQERYEIYPMSHEKFFYKVVDANIRFVKEDGEVKSLILNQFNQDLKAIKIN